jgi:hypothetical protein
MLIVGRLQFRKSVHRLRGARGAVAERVRRLVVSTEGAKLELEDAGSRQRCRKGQYDARVLALEGEGMEPHLSQASSRIVVGALTRRGSRCAYTAMGPLSCHDYPAAGESNATDLAWAGPMRETRSCMTGSAGRIGSWDPDWGRVDTGRAPARL